MDVDFVFDQEFEAADGLFAHQAELLAVLCGLFFEGEFWFGNRIRRRIVELVPVEP